MTEAEIKLEMRLSAIEYMLAKAYLVLTLSIGTKPEDFEARADEMIAEAGHQMFPVNDPALSDLASAEWQQAIANIVDLQKAFLAQKYPSLDRSKKHD